MPQKQPVTEHVPALYRAEIDPTLIRTLLCRFVPEEVGVEVATHYILGALAHQDAILEESSKWFSGEITSVEVIERDHGGKLLGKKARIHFRSRDRKSEEITDQSIDTGWIEFHGWNGEELAWEIALARTLRGVAEDNVGRKVSFRKVLRAMDDGNRVRYVADIHPSAGGGGDGNTEQRAGHSRAAGETRTPKARIASVVDDLDPNGRLQDGDIVFLAEILEDTEDGNLDKNGILREFKDYLDVKDIEEIDSDSSDLAERLTLLLLQNL